MTGFARTTTRTARKEHVCRFCMSQIAIGEAYVDEAYSDGRDFSAVRSHLECVAVEADLLQRYDIGCGDDEERSTVLDIHPDDIPITIERVPAFARRTRVVLAGVDEGNVTKLDPVPGGILASASHGKVKIDILYVAGRNSANPMLDAQSAALDSLMVAVVQSRLLEGSAIDVRLALEAGKRGGEQDLGLIRVIAHDLGVRTVQ